MIKISMKQRCGGTQPVGVRVVGRRRACFDVLVTSIFVHQAKFRPAHGCGAERVTSGIALCAWYVSPSIVHRA